MTRAKLQLRIVLVTYRQHIARNSGDGDGAAAFRERAQSILDSVELAYASEPEIAHELADVRRELDGDADDAAPAGPDIAGPLRGKGDL